MNLGFMLVSLSSLYLSLVSHSFYSPDSIYSIGFTCKPSTMRNVYNIKQSHYRNCQSVPLKYRVLRKWRKNRFFSSTKYVQNERKKKSKLTVTTIQNKDRLLRIEREKMAQLVAREGELREKKTKIACLENIFMGNIHCELSLMFISPPQPPATLWANIICKIQSSNTSNNNKIGWMQMISIDFNPKASVRVFSCTHIHTHTYWLVQAHSNIEPSMQNHHIGLISWTFCGLL